MNESDQAADIGDRLRHARVARGLSLSDIADRTKISPPSLMAMERSDFGRLPGGVFRRAYVRAFAEEVGLDADTLVREYRARYEPDEIPAPPVSVRRELLGRLRAWHGAVALVLVGLLIAFATQPGGEAQPEAMIADADRTAGDGDDATRAPDTQAADSAAAGEPGDVLFAGADTDPDAAPLRLKLQLSSPSWISVYADGERVVYRLMRGGESVRVEALRAITLHAGDAGAVDYGLNGAVEQPLGGIGEVLTVRFTGNGRQPARTRPSSGPPEGVSPVG